MARWWLLHYIAFIHELQINCRQQKGWRKYYGGFPFFTHLFGTPDYCLSYSTFLTGQSIGYSLHLFVASVNTLNTSVSQIDSNHIVHRSLVWLWNCGNIYMVLNLNVLSEYYLRVCILMNDVANYTCYMLSWWSISEFVMSFHSPFFLKVFQIPF